MHHSNDAAAARMQFATHPGTGASVNLALEPGASPLSAFRDLDREGLIISVKQSSQRNYAIVCPHLQARRR